MSILDPKQRGKPLSRKQAWVIERVASGARIVEIARDAGMSKSSVKTALLRAQAKLGARTPEQATVLYERLLRSVEEH